MNLISCSHCGVVIDLNRIDMSDHHPFGDDGPDSDQWYDDHYTWKNDRECRLIECPQCGEFIDDEGE